MILHLKRIDGGLQPDWILFEEGHYEKPIGVVFDIEFRSLIKEYHEQHEHSPVKQIIETGKIT